jgi:hypothetical protein
VHKKMLDKEAFTDCKLGVSIEARAAGSKDTGPQLYQFTLTFTYRGIGYKPPATAPSRSTTPKAGSEV